MSNRFKLTKKRPIHIDKFLLCGFMIYCATRILLIAITIFSKTTPFICFDDLYTYDTLSRWDSVLIRNYVHFRNSYYFLCMVLNRFRIFEFVTGPRLLGGILWFFACVDVKQIATYLGCSKKHSKIIFLILILSPYHMFYSLAQLREVIVAWEVIYLIKCFVRYVNKMKVPVAGVIVVSIFLYFTRTGIFEMMGACFLLYILRDSKWYIKLITMCLAGTLLMYLFVFNDNYLYVLNNKISGYLSGQTKSDGLLSRIEVTGISNVWHLILLIPYVQIIPLPGAFEAFLDWNSWGAISTFFSGLSSFFIPFFWIHIFGKGKSESEKYILLFYFGIVTLLALAQPNSSRFFVFTTPIYFLFGIEEFLIRWRKQRFNFLIGLVFSGVPYLYLLRK